MYIEPEKIQSLAYFAIILAILSSIPSFLTIIKKKQYASINSASILFNLFLFGIFTIYTFTFNDYVLGFLYAFLFLLNLYILLQKPI